MEDRWEIPVMIITGLAVVSVNIACLVLIHRNNCYKGPSAVAIFNLLSGHLTQGLLVIPAYILKRAEIPSLEVARPVCDTFRFTYMITNYLVCLSLLLLTADRLFAIKKPLWYRTNMTSRKMVYMVICCWIYTLTLCSVPFIPHSDVKSKCSYIPQKWWTIAMLSCNTMLPFLIIMYSYFVIFKTARKSRRLRTVVRKNFDAKNGYTSKKGPRNSELRIAKISAIIASAYVICWGPSFLYYFLLSTCPSCFRASYLVSNAEPIVTFIMKYLTYLNGIVNPVIYCLNRKTLKRGRCLRRNRYATNSKTHTFTSELDLKTLQNSQESPSLHEEDGDKRL